MRCDFAILLWLAVAVNGQYVIDTVAGSGWIGDDGPATQSILRQPGGVAAGGMGSVYIAETGGHRVRKVDRSGVITTVAGTGVAGFSGDGGPADQAQLASPYGLAADIFGNLYIADLGNARVRRVGLDGKVTTIAGGGTPPLIAPRNLVADDEGNVYISDFGAHRVLRIGTDGVITIIAGTGTPGYSGDGGLATAGQLAYPAGLALGFDGALYVADSANHAVRRIASGIITTVASVGSPVGLAFDLFANLYVADVEAGALLRIPASSSLPPLPIHATDVARATDFSMYAPDSAAGVVRRIPLSGEITVAAGGPIPGELLNHPSGVAADASGDLYIADRDHHRVRRVAVDGTVTTVASGVPWSSPSAISVDGAGNIYIVDSGLRQVMRITPAGAVGRIAPNLALTSPSSVVADAFGNIYIADTGAGKILSVDASGVTATLLGNLAGPQGLALDGAGHLFFTEQDAARVRQLDLAGRAVTEFAPGAWRIPRGIAVSAAGDVFVADTGRQQIVRVNTAGEVLAIAGTGVPGYSGDGGDAALATLNFPWDVAIGPGGALYVADLDNHRVRRLVPQPAAPSVVTIEVPGPIAPGMLLVLHGSDIPANPTVLINSIEVQILAMDNSQIRVQVPFNLAVTGNAEIVIVDQGSIVATVSVLTAVSAPALFPSPLSVLPGEVISLFGTGFGLGDLPVAATIGGIAADVVSFDPSPGYPGLFQIELRVPATVPPGVAGVTATVGGVASQAGINITILPQ